jgi:hypothetical protein
MVGRIAVFGSSALLACAAPVVETEHRPGYVISSDARVQIELDASASLADEAAIGDLESALHLQASRILAEAGHPSAPGDTADLLVAIRATLETDLSRTWTSEPGVSAVREVEREAVVVRVEVLDLAEGYDVWRSEARTRLPRNRLPFMPTRGEVCARTLEAALRDYDPTIDPVDRPTRSAP